MNESIIFGSHGRLGLISADARSGTEPRMLEFDVAGQRSWHYGPLFPDRRRIVLMSVDEGKSWEGAATSRLWVFSLDRLHDPTDGLTEILSDTPWPRSESTPRYMPIAAVLDDYRVLANPLIDGIQRLWTMNIDGTDVCELTGSDDGFAYGAEVSPDGSRVAWHASTASGYQVFVSDIDGQNRVRLAADPDHLYFGPTWSPDGEWIAYLDCHHRVDPGHDWADIIVNSPDGEERYFATWGRRHWMSAEWGTPEWHGNGSNLPRWSPFVRGGNPILTYCRASEGARPPWIYRADQPDTDHFNRDFLPDDASGGIDICCVDPIVGSVMPITQGGSRGVWEFRTEWSPDGSRIAFCRALPGRPSELWVMDADGSNERALTLGWEHRGVDHPRWVG